MDRRSGIGEPATHARETKPHPRHDATALGLQDLRVVGDMIGDEGRDEIVAVVVALMYPEVQRLV